MMDSRGKAVGRYLLRLVGGVSVIIGLLMAFSSLVDANLVGIVLSAVLIGGGVFALKRSGGPRRAEASTSVPVAGR
ncbi:hypothetical protein [Micromonospora robiginosa]|uniref:Uncharacterized protein n=1 Tax=Micromonospora robiginosa TaxID=2749844 RepID=A0A7L6B0S9_9ACTN|nr:hypothetical protein [Micromonospora ferruginea]QLQ35446.1 hypothetical protein H1D33_18855 [Micromonospora ferruginea]